MLRFLTASLLLLPAACQTISAEAITPEVVRVASGHDGFVKLKVAGARGLPAAVLSEAVYDTILASGLFEGITTAGEDWILSVTVVEFDDPEWGLDITAQVAMRWKLTGAGGEVYWTERIETEHTATPEDAFTLGERESLAISEAVLKNLTGALERLVDLDLSR